MAHASGTNAIRLTAFVAYRDEFRYLDPAGSPPQISNGFRGFVDLRLRSIDFAGNDQSFVPLFLIEESGR